MLKTIKVYTVNTGVPSLADLEEAKEICVDEDCAVELRWMPNIVAGWYHLYIDSTSNVYEIYDKQVPKVYGW